MTTALDDLTAHLLNRLALVQQSLGLEPVVADADSRFADVLDSMGMVEFLMVLARDCGVTSGAVEECAGRTFTTVGRLAECLRDSG